MATYKHIRRLKFQLDRKSLQIIYIYIYISFIRHLLEYTDVVWDNCTQQEANDLEKNQNEAAHIVTGATKLASIQSLLSNTGWESLTSRREKHKLVLFYKMINYLVPEYLSSLVPPTVGNISQYNLRNETNLQTIPARSQQYYNSFLSSSRAFGTVFQTILRALHLLDPLSKNSTTKLPDHHLTTLLVHD